MIEEINEILFLEKRKLLISLAVIIFSSIMHYLILVLTKISEKFFLMIIGLSLFYISLSLCWTILYYFIKLTLGRKNGRNKKI